ncbi:MAG: diadenylate cyclase, partial [Syntrophorhabdaceae bacterium]|nr:diadenylate cyclase [Syntrophorhabdaceae bacterium]
RRALAKIGQWRFFDINTNFPDRDALEEIVKCAFRFSSCRIGAIFLLERKIGLEDFVEHGRKIDAVFSTELAESIFNINSPIHDGAVVVRGNRIEAAGIILPIPPPALETQGMGTRHRAAFGAAADTDAVAVVISEETGNVTVFNNRVKMRAESPEELKLLLVNIFRVKRSQEEVD